MPLRLVPGVYDHLLDDALARLVDGLEPPLEAALDSLEPGELPRYLADHLRALALRALESVRGQDAAETTARQLSLANELLARLARAVDKAPESLFDDGELSFPAPARRLLRVAPKDPLVSTRLDERPQIPLAESALLVNARGEPSLGSELRRELHTADHVDLLCAFVKWSGLRLVVDRLRALVERGGRLRVLTTTYIGASELRAIEELSRIGAEVRISYDTRRTRLHAKAWLFRRGSGLDTAYIGSSNLSKDALHEGLEWNVRLSRRDAAPLLDKFGAAFESYWASDEFVPFDPARDRERVKRALSAERSSSEAQATPLLFELRPHPYQEAILEALSLERARGHTRNLVVAPTGTGKTLVAAFDYARLRDKLPRARLLFVAHRERLLEQSRAAFRQVLRDGSFGELFVGGERPEIGEHVFASVQSLARVSLDELAPDRFDVVIIDEFHHAEAPTYTRLLEHLRPRVLLGLTATPERHDGGDVRRWFDGRTTYEMRLWDALEQGLLAPFQYFGVHDGVDLSDVEWKRTGYDRAELEQVYTGNEARLRLVVKELHRRVLDPFRMRALAFCVGVEHARFMAERLTEAGIRSEAVTGETDRETREAAIRKLERGELQALCTVDLFNEGVDIPSVDTVLFLRPTESATVFLQQLGRGLRLHPGKPGLTVLDFIGNARREFRFDRRFRALLGGSTRSVAHQIEAGFPQLPAGCALQLDAVAQRVVLGNIQSRIKTGARWLTEELRALGPETRLDGFLDEVGIDPVELYANRRSFTSLRAGAFGPPLLDDGDARLHARLGALLHVNDEERLGLWLRWLKSPPPFSSLSPREQRVAHMLLALFRDRVSIAELGPAFEALLSKPLLREELTDLLTYLEDRRREATAPWRTPTPAPLHLHGRYRQEEVLSALRVLRGGTLPRLQSGVFYVEEQNLDLLFVTLQKTERGFSPSTMYRDYAISPTRLHWESQNTAHAESPTGRRYLERSSTVCLFVREAQKLANGVAEPYVFLGPARLVHAEGARPMQIVWELERPMPALLYQHATLAAG